MPIPGTFFGLDIGLSGLQTAQAAQTVTGNNISNAGTAGYTVESPDIVQEPSGPVTGGSFDGGISSTYGSGSLVNTITRNRSQYLDLEFRNAQSVSSSETALSSSLGDVQSSFNEPSTSGINQAMTTFFNSLDDLQNTPSSVAVRATVVDNAAALAQTIQTVQGNLTTNAQSVTNQTSLDIGQVNTLGQQIAALNVQIMGATGGNIEPNTLLDQRDLLIDNLSKLVNVSTIANTNGTVNVAIGSSDLVVGTQSDTVNVATMQSRGDLTSGELSGLAQSQTAIASYQSSLNTLAATIVSTVNAVQSTGAGLDGSTGVAFFTATTGSEASTIAVNPVLQNSPAKLAAGSLSNIVSPATTPPPSDSSNVTLMENIATTDQSALGNQTIQGYYNTLITNLGAQTSGAQLAATNATASTTQFSSERASVEGVSTDTEMTNMMIYQRSYQAAAQFISTQDSMLNTLVNTMFGS